jgi:hypothetical protein
MPALPPNVPAGVPFRGGCRKAMPLSGHWIRTTVVLRLSQTRIHNHDDKKDPRISSSCDCHQPGSFRSLKLRNVFPFVASFSEWSDFSSSCLCSFLRNLSLCPVRCNQEAQARTAGAIWTTDCRFDQQLLSL